MGEPGGEHHDGEGLDASTEEAWTAFRRALADWFVGGGLGVLALIGAGRPAFCDGPVLLLVRSVRGTIVLEPGDDRPGGVLRLARPVGDADVVAVQVVDALRHHHGVQHPALLDPEGLPAVLAPPAADVVDRPVLDRLRADPWPGEPLDGATAVEVRDAEHLRALVDQALGPALQPDADGDYLVATGGPEMVVVRVRDDRPLVELFAHLALEVEHLDRVAGELDILNRRHPSSTFFRDGGRGIVMRRCVHATHLVPDALRAALGAMCAEVGPLAADLRARVGGQSFLGRVDTEGADSEDDNENGAAPRRSGVAPTDDGAPSAGFAQLLELLHGGPVPPAVVAELYDHDRTQLVRDLVACRRDGEGCDVHDEVVLLDHLRSGLRHVATRGAEARETGRVAPRPVRSQQLPLLSDDDLGTPTLDVDWRHGGDPHLGA